MTNDNTLDTTVDEWRIEIEKLKEGDPGMTMAELSEEFNIPPRTLARKINKLIRERRCTQGTAQRIDAIGRRQYVPVYRLIKKESK